MVHLVQGEPNGEQFRPPTIEQVKFEAERLRLPESQAEQFFFFYSKRRWRSAEGYQIIHWERALLGWAKQWWMAKLERRQGQFKMSEDN